MNFENKQYKDTVFRMLFNDKARLLELYNAINGTNYDNPDDLTITTLEGNTYLNMKNDISFIIAFELNLFEHQSSPCPNIPLRDLYYVASTFMKIVSLRKTYRSTKVTIPTPGFFVFYNGDTKMEDKAIYKLSDLFEHKVEKPSLDLEVTVFNVNEGHNKKLMETCETLKNYSIFVSKVRKYIKEAKASMDLSDNASFPLDIDSEIKKKIISDAVKKAIDECIAENILKEFFMKYKDMVVDISYMEYTAEGHMQEIADENYEIGYDKAKKEDEAIIADKDATIAEKDATIADKDATIADKDAALADKDASIADMLTLIQKYKDKFGDL